jgi:short-subunit dehydrogenase
MEYFRGKAAIVTGGSSGLGLAIAQALINAGANVTIAARSVDALNAAAARLRTLNNGEVLSVTTDVTQVEDVERMVAASVDRFDRLDILVNCAGSSARGDVRSTTVDDFRRLMELNFFALVACTRTALPLLLAAKGHIVNIGSLASKSASRYLGAYPASKFAVAAYSQQLRLELSDQGLHVMLVCPGPIARDQERIYPGSESLPSTARRAGAGVKVARIDPDWLARKILRGLERRELEIVVPWRARLLFALSQLCPSCGDWLVRKMTS